MEHKEKPEQGDKKSLQEPEDHVQMKGALKEEDREKIQQAKEAWQAAWNKFKEALMAPERIGA